MGYLLNGAWHEGWYETAKTAGEFVRPASAFRDRITADRSSVFRAERGRYHLYVSLACPWAHRTLVFRKLKQLEDVISVSVVEPVMSSEGWAFSDALPDHLNGLSRLHEVYTRAQPAYSGRVTVPVLWDKQRETIVNNESAEIIRMLNTEFSRYVPVGHDYYPEALRAQIDEINSVVYANVNNGVYRCGFAGTQKAYEAAAKRLFDTLDMLEERLSRTRYLVGNILTEADWRLFTTLVRFDAVYHGHFKCNLSRIEDYPNLSGYLRELYQVPGVAETVSLDHIKRHYYMSHQHINPSRIVPVGPLLDLERAHDRARFEQ
ncbi:MAG TPA: glutathione S-transferase family protein [Burkholderiales bacterium]|nr:glutathione S-transferase family protein [Burkholderiales bacterium]